MESRPIGPEVILNQSKEHFKNVLLDNDVVARLVFNLVEKHMDGFTDANRRILGEPSVTTEAEKDPIGGIQLGFKIERGDSSSTKWLYIDLFSFDVRQGTHAPTPELLAVATEMLPTEEVDAGVEAAWINWINGMHSLIEQVPEGLYLNTMTGEVDLYNNMPNEHRAELLLPLQ